MRPNRAVQGRSHGRENATYALLAAFFAFAHVRLMILLMPRVLLLSAHVGEGVVRGEPPWRVYQSRVLGPSLVHALGSWLGIPTAYSVLLVLILAIAGFLILKLTARLEDPARPPIATFLIFQATFLFLVPGIWLYSWDMLALLVFTIFNYLVLSGARKRWFAALFVPAILNHETAFYIAGWLVVNPIVRVLAGWRSRALRTGFGGSSLALGVALIAGGAVLIEGLRNALLVRESLRPEELVGLIDYGRSFHYSLLANLGSIVDSFTLAVPKAFPFLVPAFLVLVLVLAIRLARVAWVRCGALAAVVIAMVAGFMLFGQVFETRVLMPLVPFVAMNGWAAFRGREA